MSKKKDKIPIKITPTLFKIALTCLQKSHYHSQEREKEIETPILHHRETNYLHQLAIQHLKNQNSETHFPIIANKKLENETYIAHADIFIDKGETIELYLVKSRAISGETKTPLTNSQGAITPRWKTTLKEASYLHHIATQIYTRPVTTHLILPDKNKPLEPNMSPHETLTTLPITELCQTYLHDHKLASFIKKLTYTLQNNHPIDIEPSTTCRNCKFHQPCWQEKTPLSPSDFDRPLVWDLWNFPKANELIQQGHYFLEEIDPQKDIPKGKNTWRQQLQLKKHLENDKTPYFNREKFQTNEAQWHYPLHFIDFETANLPIAGFTGQRAGDLVAFQFSHHTMNTQKEIAQSGEYLSFRERNYPNFDFLRTLKKQIEKDQGTLFHYGNHEKQVLNKIKKYLYDSNEPDKTTLIQWLEDLLNHRQLVDLSTLACELYLDPTISRGSNSLKKLFPAVLQQNPAIRTLFLTHFDTPSTPKENIDPYKELTINDGGVAQEIWLQNLYTPQQFTDKEAQKIHHTLQKYCSLDTHSMALIMKHWFSLAQKK